MKSGRPRLGVVTNSRIKNGRVVVDVSFDRPGATKSNIPFFQPFSGGFITPRENDQVQLYQLADSSYVAMFPLSGTQYVPSDMGAGELAFMFDEDTKLRVKRAADGTFDVSVSASGNVEINATGEVVVDSPSVKLGGSTGTKVVAREGDTVQTSDPLTGTNTGTITSGSSVTESQ